MAVIVKRKRTDGTRVYRVQDRTTGYPSFSKSFLSFDDAKRCLVKVQVDRQVGQDGIVRGRLTLAEAVTAFTETAEFRGRKSGDDTRRHLEWWSSRMGRRPLAKITPDLIADNPHRLEADGLTGSTVNRYRSVLSRLFRYAVKTRRWLAHNPCAGADTFMKDNETLRGVVNSGHTRVSAYVIRTVGDDFEPREFSTCCPKAIAAIGQLPDTITDRSIVLRMRRKAPGETVAPLPDANDLLPIRRRLSRSAADNAEAIAAARPELPPGVINRRADNWRSLVAIACAAGGEWPELARFACAAAVAADDGEESLRVTLLADIREVFAVRGADRVSTADIIADLKTMPERPWLECHRGKEISARQLARWLGEFGIGSRDIRPQAQKNCKGYCLEDFSDAFLRYLPTEYTWPELFDRDLPVSLEVGIHRDLLRLRPAEVLARDVRLFLHGWTMRPANRRTLTATCRRRGLKS